LWPIEFFLPYPHIIEELAKYFLALNIKDLKSKSPYTLGLLSGITFAFSETIFYLTKIATLGSLSTLVVRLILTFILHSTTIITMIWFCRAGKSFALAGLIVAIIIHYFYNNFVVQLISI